MKKKKCLLFILATFILMMQQIRADAQLTNVNWSQPINHPCYKGLSISVSNMGWSDDVKAYLWGVRIKNNYDIPVSFRYLLTVGSEKKGLATNYFAAAWKLKSGDTLTDGGNVFTANIYKDPSADWTVVVGDVCFDGMRCGAPDNCYADCDVQFRKPNQLCGLSASAPLNAPDNKIEPSAASGTQIADKKSEDKTPDIGETSNWIRDDKQVEVNMGKTEKGLYWKRKNDKQYVFFEKLPSGAYRYEVGKDFYILQFVSATKVQFSENGTVTNHYTLVSETEKAIENQEISITKNAEWQHKEYSGIRFIVVVNDDYLVLNDKGIPLSWVYTKISAATYEYKGQTSSSIIKFISNTKYIFVSGKANAKMDTTYYQLVSSDLSQEKPKTITQNIPDTDIAGKWEYVGTKEYRELQLSAKGDSLYAKFPPYGGKPWIYKKTGQFVYTQKTDSTISILKYLNDTILSISYQHRNLNTLSYYTRPAAAPIVKQEDKPAPVIENRNAIPKIGNWINTNPTGGWDEFTLEFTESGILLQVSFDSKYFFKKIGSAEYLYSDGSYKTYLKVNAINSITIEFSNFYGKINQINHYVPKQ